MAIEGIPDGWELVRVGEVKNGEFFILSDGSIEQHDRDKVLRMNKNYVIIRKIEKPKQFRAFANAAEFEPHRDKWIKQKLENADHRFKTQAYSNLMHYAGQDGEEWEAAFDYFEFEDGTPFGVEVVE